MAAIEEKESWRFRDVNYSSNDERGSNSPKNSTPKKKNSKSFKDRAESNSSKTVLDGEDDNAIKFVDSIGKYSSLSISSPSIKETINHFSEDYGESDEWSNISSSPHFRQESTISTSDNGDTVIRGRSEGILHSSPEEILYFYLLDLLGVEDILTNKNDRNNPLNSPTPSLPPHFPTPTSIVV